MKINTPMSLIYEKIWKTQGRTAHTIHLLNVNGQLISKLPDILNTPASSFANIFTLQNDSQFFWQIQQTQESVQLNFTSENIEEYNLPLSFTELVYALSKVGYTSPGPDRIHYQMLTKMPNEAKIYLLSSYNKFWQESYFPAEWRQATIIPIPKTNKDHSDPLNYQPISLVQGSVLKK